MHVHINHMYCTDPLLNKKGKMYWCRYMVSVEKHKEDNKTLTPDYESLTEEFKFFDEEEYNNNIASYKKLGYDIPEEESRKWATKTRYRFKPEIVQWLNDNIKDRVDADYPQGWCCGSDAYMAREWNAICLFFHRKKRCTKVYRNLEYS